MNIGMTGKISVECKVCNKSFSGQFTISGEDRNNVLEVLLKATKEEAKKKNWMDVFEVVKNNFDAKAAGFCSEECKRRGLVVVWDKE